MTIDAQRLYQAIEGLNPAQRQAVESPPHHLLVSAGAGTGKTRVLSLRYLNLVHRYGVAPEHIMAVTFTNKAAQEMKERLRPHLPVHQLWIGTFHALGLRLLRLYTPLTQRASGFTVLDPSDQNSMVQKVLKDNPIYKAITPRIALNAISEGKHGNSMAASPSKQRLYEGLMEEYQQQLALMNALDFDDLLIHSLALLRDHPEVLVNLPFSHVLVDEYQDINDLQYRWLKAFQGAWMFCVGDDDQSIYGWRGADVEKILQFPKDFPGAHVICLEDNYRSTPHILAAASHLIGHNRSRYGKTLRTQHTTGEKLHVQGLWDSAQEASFVTDTILRLSREEKLSTMAILIRTSAQSREFEECLTLHNVPYHLVGGTRFYDRLEIRDLVAYLRVVHSQGDNLAFERMLGAPKRGIGPVSLKTLYQGLGPAQPSLEIATRQALEGTFPPEGALGRTLKEVIDAIDSWRDLLSSTPLPALAENILQRSGYGEFWAQQGAQGHARLENIKEFIKSLGDFENLAQCLEHISLLSEVSSGQERESVAIMTLHSAKGLEFETVFLPGWEENLFPHIRALEESGIQGAEEERRLAYVGITRAKKRAFISFCWNRRSHSGMMPSVPSRFIHELPPEHTDMVLKLHHPHALPQKGRRVHHHLFGQGSVQSEAGSLISVLFDTHGLKKIMARFLTFLS